MHCHVDILNPIDYPCWDELLISSRGYSFYHTSAWAKVLCESYRYHPVYFTLLDKNKFLAMTPMMEVRSILTGRRGVCLPFTDQCESIGDNSSGAEDMIESIKDYGRRRRWEFIDLRWGDYPNETPAVSFYGHKLDLTLGAEQLFCRFRHSVRTAIRKAIRAGVNVKIHTSIEALKEYYRLHCISRQRHGLPPQPYCFFEKVYEHIICKDLGFIVLACYCGANIAGAMFFNFGDKSVCKFAASDYRYQHLRANDLVIWEAIKWQAQRGYQSLCF
ncbi:MAG: GNAT family N-acetyltransferase, partial [Sedimentisphaerales bacterium]|nr:GNAT family N-acetyltransferase [Sedimentisphaerales bacterium]